MTGRRFASTAPGETPASTGTASAPKRKNTARDLQTRAIPVGVYEFSLRYI